MYPTSNLPPGAVPPPAAGGPTGAKATVPKHYSELYRKFYQARTDEYEQKLNNLAAQAQNAKSPKERASCMEQSKYYVHRIDVLAYRLLGVQMNAQKYDERGDLLEQLARTPKTDQKRVADINKALEKNLESIKAQLTEKQVMDTERSGPGRQVRRVPIEDSEVEELVMVAIQQALSKPKSKDAG